MATGFTIATLDGQNNQRLLDRVFFLLKLVSCYDLNDNTQDVCGWLSFICCAIYHGRSCPFNPKTRILSRQTRQEPAIASASAFRTIGIFLSLDYTFLSKSLKLRRESDSNNDLKPFSQGVRSKMTSKLIPSNPSEVMVIRTVIPNIVTMSTPFARFGRFKVGGRGTIGESHTQEAYTGDESFN
jgi:hypothetical protein